MSLIEMGGWMMIPLLLISVAVTAIIIEKGLIFYWNPMPKALKSKKAAYPKSFQDIEEIAGEIKTSPWLEDFSEILTDTKVGVPLYENNLQQTMDSIVAFLEKRLALLLTLAKVSPMLGLLGTVLGIIKTFSVIAQSTSGVDMELLSQGIWQALITTAAGLMIAVPALLFFRWYQGAANARLKTLNAVANAAVAARKADHD